MLVEYIIPRPITVSSNVANNTIINAIPRSSLLVTKFSSLSITASL
jgi:hypothetical protein